MTASDTRRSLEVGSQLGVYQGDQLLLAGDTVITAVRQACSPVNTRSACAWPPQVLSQGTTASEDAHVTVSQCSRCSCTVLNCDNHGTSPLQVMGVPFMPKGLGTTTCIALI